MLLEAQELARQRLSAEERATLAATVPESAQRQMLDDTAYALQVCVIEASAGVLHWRALVRGRGCGRTGLTRVVAVSAYVLVIVSIRTKYLPRLLYVC